MGRKRILLVDEDKLNQELLDKVFDSDYEILDEKIKAQTGRTDGIAEMLKRDRVTGLWNREAFLEEVDTFLQNVAPEELHDYVIVYGNIINFKYYNLKYGVASGDKVLKFYAAIANFDENCVFSGRVGQDHIVSLIKYDDVPALLKTGIDLFNKQYTTLGMQLKAGIYRFQNGDETAVMACEMAKLACDSIRDTAEDTCLYNDNLSREVEIRAYVLQNFDEAIDRHYIEVYYQPVVRTINGMTCGMEALARWNDPKKGLLPPKDFIQTLEENRLITKLDLYVLREICRFINTEYKAGNPTVPISFNLSRMDFQECDIFTEVENIVRENGIARDMINIEITESTVMEDPELLKGTMKRFRDNGYQVWMDDFGSGYSSLNVLKDFEFDEIKLDMRFMSSFTENSKNIVTSIIEMAKRLGVQTLAEGVETKEQYDFLYNIGCEKVQGYYFSKPLCRDALLQHELTHPERMESRAWRNYYTALGQVNFITDRALGLVEWTGREYRYLYINKVYEKVMNSTGVTLEQACANLNTPSLPFSRLLNDFRNSCHVGDGQREIIYTARGRYIRVLATCIAEHGSYSTLKAEVMNMSASDVEVQRRKLESVGNRLFDFFDTVFLCDLNDSSFETIRHADAQEHAGFGSLNKAHTINEAINAAFYLIYPSERGAFMEFSAPDSIKERVAQDKNALSTKYFRTLTNNGAYVWKAHTILYMADINKYLYVTRTLPEMGDTLSNQKTFEQISPEMLLKSGHASQKWWSIIQQAINESNTMNIFWKDTQRRFVGANKSFLKTYGFDSVQEILGKTDEQMGWHILDGPFANDEKDVLEHGTVIHHRHGTCMIKGVAHNIIASKEPIYDDGKIVGLIGYFIDADEFADRLQSINFVDSTDEHTGLLSTQGVMNVLGQYAEGWEVHGNNYAVIRIGIKEYRRTTASYGEIAAREMFREVAQILADTVGVRGTCARLYAGNFVVIMRCEDKNEVQALAAAIEKRIINIHTLSGYAVSLYPHLELAFADESKGIFAMLGMATDSKLMTDSTWYNDDLNLDVLWQTYENLQEVVYAADIDTHELIYMNRVARNQYYCASLEQLKGKKCYELIMGKNAPCSICTNEKLLNGETYEWDYFNQTIGRYFHLQDQMIIHEGRRIRIEVATEITPPAEPSLQKDNLRLQISECMRIALEDPDYDHALQTFVETLGRTLKSERTYIFEDNGHDEWDNTREWCAAGVTPQIDNLQNVPYSATAVWMQKFSVGEFVAIRNLEAIKDEDPECYEYLKPQDIHCIITAPIYLQGKLYGFYGVDNPPLEMFDTVLSMIKTVGHVFETLLENRATRSQLEALSYQDGLLGLGNRNAFKRDFRKLRRDKSLGVVFCDVCGLKLINDTLGHTAGDASLLQTRDIMLEVFDKSNIYRWGGDEMIVLISGISRPQLEEAVIKLKNLCDERNALIATGSIWKNAVLETAEELLDDVDVKMYEDKQRIHMRRDMLATFRKNEVLKQFFE